MIKLALPLGWSNLSSPLLTAGIVVAIASPGKAAGSAVAAQGSTDALQRKVEALRKELHETRAGLTQELLDAQELIAAQRRELKHAHEKYHRGEQGRASLPVRPGQVDSR
jgi:hypothetical protein